jgi:hypothetical protein
MLLDYIREPRISEHLVSLTGTTESVLSLVGNVALFLEDYSRPDFGGESLNYMPFDMASPPHRRSCRAQLEKTNHGGFR